MTLHAIMFTVKRHFHSAIHLLLLVSAGASLCACTAVWAVSEATHSHKYAMASSAGEAVTFAASLNEKRIQNELRGNPPDIRGYTWRGYWQSYYRNLQRQIESTSDPEERSVTLSILEHIKRRRAELGLPNY